MLFWRGRGTTTEEVLKDEWKRACVQNIPTTNALARESQERSHMVRKARKHMSCASVGEEAHADFG